MSGRSTSTWLTGRRLRVVVPATSADVIAARRRFATGWLPTGGSHARWVIRSDHERLRRLAVAAGDWASRSISPDESRAVA
jgi:hypothetical protein